MTELDRRSFLELAGKRVAALGVAAWPATAYRSQSEVPEVAVIGAGAFGGWTALYLREMGLSLTLIDAYGPGNARSSSAGETRQIRAAYGERELYSRWAIQALERWKAREAEWGKRLLFQTGQITFGSDWSSMRTTKTVLDRLGVENEIIPPDELARRYPQFNHGGAEYGFYTPSTGVLLCRVACLEVADAFQRPRWPVHHGEGAPWSARRRTASRSHAIEWRNGLSAKLRVCVRAVASKDVSRNSGKQAPFEPAHDFFYGDTRR